MKRPPTEWEKIFANNISNKVLISNTYKDIKPQTQKGKEDNTTYISTNFCKMGSS